MQRGLGEVKMTNAQLGMNRSIREKWIELPVAPTINSFKLKRFTADIGPKVSTKRGDQPFMMSSAKKAANTSVTEIQASSTK